MLKLTSKLLAIALAMTLLTSSAQSATKDSKEPKATATKKASSKKSPTKKTSAKKSSSKKAATSKKSASAEKADSPRGRLPRYYGKLDLKDEQRTGIYTIQAEYAQQLLDLHEKIKELKEKETKAIEKVLTRTQRSKLSEMSTSRSKTKTVSTKRSKKS